MADPWKLGCIAGEDDVEVIGYDDEVGQSIVTIRTPSAILSEMESVHTAMNQLNNDWWNAKKAGKLHPEEFAAWDRFYQEWWQFRQANAKNILGWNAVWDKIQEYKNRLPAWRDTLKASGGTNRGVPYKPSDTPGHGDTPWVKYGLYLAGGLAAGYGVYTVAGIVQNKAAAVRDLARGKVLSAAKRMSPV